MILHSRDMICPSFASSSALFKREGAGNTGCWPHPRALRAKNFAFHARKQRQGSRDNRRSLRDGLRLIRPLLGLPGFLAAVASRDHLSAKLDPSVGGSGPYDFAVRGLRASSVARSPCPPHPASRFVTNGQNAPLAEAGRARPYV